MSWIDEAKLRRAKIQNARQAQEDQVKLRRAEIERAERARQAQAKAAAEAERTKGLNRYVSDVKRVLPPGVEIVEAFFSDRPEVSYLIPAVRVALGNGAQFDLELGRYTEEEAATWTGGACYGYYAGGYVRTGMSLNAYEVGGPWLDAIHKKFLGRPSRKHFSKREMEDLLFNALEKHHSGHRQGLSR
jgi:hypothetical protein